MTSYANAPLDKSYHDKQNKENSQSKNELWMDFAFAKSVLETCLLNVHCTVETVQDFFIELGNTPLMLISKLDQKILDSL